jgi:hypothetical protein
MRGLIVSVVSLGLLSVVGYAGSHAAGKRAEVDGPLGKRFVICDDGASVENAWFDLLSNKMRKF